MANIVHDDLFLYAYVYILQADFNHAFGSTRWNPAVSPVM